MAVCPEIAKNGLIDLLLACSIGKLYGFEGFSKKFFRAESDPKMQFGCIAHNLMHYSGVNT